MGVSDLLSSRIPVREREREAPNPNVVTESRRTWSKHILGIGHENEYPKLVSKFWGLPPKEFEGGQSLEI